MTAAPHAILVAHGAPADPEPQEAALHALAAAVCGHLPGWDIRGATLAREGSLACALWDNPAALIYPLFMAEGWFTKRELPRRLAGEGAAPPILPPLGVDPALPDLVARIAAQGAEAAGLSPARTHLLLAAHGSKVARASKDSSYDMAQALRARGLFAAVSVGLIEEPPFLAEAARGLGPALCLPFFALAAGHVTGDIPEALAEAGFEGPCLPPVGLDPAIPALIAAALRRGAAG